MVQENLNVYCALLQASLIFSEEAYSAVPAITGDVHTASTAAYCCRELLSGHLLSGRIAV